MEELTEQLLRHSIIEGTDPGRGRRVRDQVYRVLAPELLEEQVPLEGEVQIDS